MSRMPLENLPGGIAPIALHRGLKRVGLVLLFVALSSNNCGKEEDALAPSISISGEVTDNSGRAGHIIVEIDYYLRDVADAAGRYSIALHKDFYVDSLYAWVDEDSDGAYTQGESFGFYHSSGEPHRARPIHMRSSDVGGIDFSIP